MVDTVHVASLPQLPLWTHVPGNNLGQTGGEVRKPDKPKLFLSLSPFFLALTDLFFNFGFSLTDFFSVTDVTNDA